MRHAPDFAWSDVSSDRPPQHDEKAFEAVIEGATVIDCARTDALTSNKRRTLIP
jgi:hypothetical protein